MSENAISVRGINVSYLIHKNNSIKNILKSRKKTERIQALKDVSFDVPKGEILGIIGKNGSGKSTLLRTIGGIFSPDSGNVELYGNKVSLLSIGVGFNERLTGRENIILSGLLTGYTREEIDERMESIIDFSELEEFIDRPVHTYSSGMYSKLAFSVAAELNTDILLIDEVLSVGDEHFSKKSYYRMQELIKDRNHTVIIVSHNIRTLQELCDKVMWLQNGVIQEIDDAETVLGHYMEMMQREA